jgi:hypothetical protein
MLSFSISYPDLMKFPCFADIPLREGVEGESRFRRQGDFTDNSNIYLATDYFPNLVFCNANIPKPGSSFFIVFNPKSV